jgi:hypothetical protein
MKYEIYTEIHLNGRKILFHYMFVRARNRKQFRQLFHLINESKNISLTVSFNKRKQKYFVNPVSFIKEGNTAKCIWSTAKGK